jgi:hypothetical protein
LLSLVNMLWDVFTKKASVESKDKRTSEMCTIVLLGVWLNNSLPVNTFGSVLYAGGLELGGLY